MPDIERGDLPPEEHNLVQLVYNPELINEVRTYFKDKKHMLRNEYIESLQQTHRHEVNTPIKMCIQ